MADQLFGVNPDTLTASLQALERDICKMDPAAKTYFCPPSRGELKKWGPDEFHDYMRIFCDGAIYFAGQREPVDFEPTTRFGKAILEVNHIENLATVNAEATCIESEPRLLRSLGFHTLANISDKGYAGLPGAILLDDDDTPIGYQKSSGTPSTYTWSSNTLETQRGLQASPADSFNVIEYDWDLWKRLEETHAGLVAVHASVDNILNFGVERLSAVSFTPTVRRAMAVAASEMEPKLAEHIEDAVSFKPEDIQQKVEKLMETGHVELIQ